MPDPVLEYQSPQDPLMRVHNTAATASVVFAVMLALAIAIFVLTSRAIGTCMVIPALIAAIAAISFGVVGRRRAEVLDGVGRVRAGWGIAVGVGGIVLMGLALFASVWALGRSMERVNRVRCTTNMRHIYYAVQLFAKEHQGALPTATGELLDDLHVSTFVCNSSHDKPAPGPTTREVAANLEKREHTSYVYVGSGMTWPVRADVVIAYEESDNHDGEGIHVLFGDGVVKWYTAKEAEELLSRLTAPTSVPVR